MNEYFGMYRIETTRYRNWDYSWEGKYFITVCTRNFDTYFGEINNGNMELSEIGVEVERQWMKTILLRPDMNLTLADFQVMPNHFHAIIEIGPNIYNDKKSDFIIDGKSRNKFGSQSKNLGSIIRGFKAAVTIFANDNNLKFGWHPRFHDHLIRNDMELFKIKKYIQNNVENWSKDRFSKNIKFR